MCKKKNLFRIAALLLMTAAVFLSCTACVVIGSRKPIATIVFSNGVEATVRLYPDKAPNTVNNFIKLANSGFYDGSPVHRIVEYVLIQMGKPGNSEETDAGYYIKGEFADNGYVKDNLTFNEGILGMARLASEDGDDKKFYNTGSSQFFIMLEPKASMDGKYTAFGKVVTGMSDIVAISKMDVDDNDEPRDEIYIVSLRVDCYDYKPSEPKTLTKESQKLY